MQNARRAGIKLLYNGVDISRDIAPFLLSFTYVDQAHGKSDDLQVSLQDVAGNWRNPWFPDKGATLTAEIHTLHWQRQGEWKVLPCGRFQIDEITCKGPPTTVDIKAVSVPVQSSARQERRSKGWEEILLSKIAAEVAQKQGLSFSWNSSYDPLLDRRDQAESADLGFLKRQCERVGLALKVTDEKLVIFDEEDYEARDAVDTISYSDLFTKRLISYSFRNKSAGVYKGAKLQYHDSVKDETFEVYTASENVAQSGQVLNVNERVKSGGEAQKIAEKRLFQANKHEVTGSMSMMGNMAMLGGSTIAVVGFGKFDGKYFIEKATHKYSKGGGYTTDTEIRRGGPKSGNKGISDGGFPVYGLDDGGDDDDE